MNSVSDILCKATVNNQMQSRSFRPLLCYFKQWPWCLCFNHAENHLPRFEAKRAPVPYFCVFIFPHPLPFSCSHCCNHWLWALHLSGGCCWLTLSNGVWSWRSLTKMLWFFGWLKSPSCGSLDLYRTCSLWEQRSFLYVGFDSFTLTHPFSLLHPHLYEIHPCCS